MFGKRINAFEEEAKADATSDMKDDDSMGEQTDPERDTLLARDGAKGRIRLPE